MQRLRNYETIVLGILSKSMGALYGVLAMSLFLKIENLNLWIISCYVGSIITLANIIIIPEVFSSTKNRKKIESLVFGSKSGYVFKKERLYSALILHGILFCSLFFLDYGLDYQTKVVLVFLLQGLQIPFLLKFLSRNEVTYFTHNRSNLLKATLIGNGFSLIPILILYLFSLNIDSSLYTFTAFLVWQIGALIVQEFCYAIYSRKTGEVIQVSHNSDSELRFVRKVLNLRMYLYVPCLASLFAFLSNPASKEISSIFLGLNAMTLLTFLGLPNDKKSHLHFDKRNFLLSLKKLILRALAIYILIVVSLVSGVLILGGLIRLPFFLEPQGIVSILALTGLGIFLLPIVTLENNRVLLGEKRSQPLEIAITVMLCTYLYMAFVCDLTVTWAIAGSFAVSYFIWYSITITMLIKGSRIEQRF